jgi:hypothetical protein
MEDDVELLLPRYDPNSQAGKREKSRFRFSENVIHLIPLILLLCVAILWLSSYSGKPRNCFNLYESIIDL